ncbi:hypothetical protein BDZ90DRAFT_144637 [Jaminaea rosea]|uniref:Uncharacterized protein n=1 Tax=Jaminaea rosea TaxID=1569628 RepID=A0A316USN7_9BASI|nr:hypothetical protein BDZ90DRAFT_144637 [Jaminaea rosea]PWN28307.1 hypothetical protein BDZ90DRAFT_144637 [Jaminaea rosea]
MRKICARKMASVNDQSASNVTACPKNRRESPYTWVVPALQCKEGRRRSMKASHDRALRAFVTTYAQSSIAKILTLADRALSSFPRAPLSASRYHEPFPAVMRCCSEEGPPSASDSLVSLRRTPIIVMHKTQEPLGRPECTAPPRGCRPALQTFFQSS